MVEQPMVVDAHVHFWDPQALDYPWLRDEPSLARSYAPAEYTPLADGTVESIVFVEANCAPTQSEREVARIEALATDDPRIVGIVAYADLSSSDSGGAALARLTKVERVVGIRQNIQGRPAGFCVQPAFVRGVQRVGEMGRTFDLCVTADQLPEAIDLVRQCPGTRFVLDHCGKPDVRNSAFASWANDIALLAACENVWCKLSGLLTQADPGQRSADVLAPYADHVLDRFGHARMMYGSDWPVVNLAGGVDVWRTMVDRFTSSWSDADRQSFYGDNAVRFYGLRLHADR